MKNSIAGETDRRCHHCDAPLLPAHAVQVTLDGRDYPVCCNGCAAAAERTHAARTPANEQAVEGAPKCCKAATERIKAPVVQLRQSATLHVDGIYCGGCAGLIETTLAKLDGIVTARLNPVSACLHLQWDDTHLSLDTIAAEVHKLGYRTRAQSVNTGTGGHLQERRAALKRLIVAGIGMMQVMMIAVSLYAGGWTDMEPDIAHFMRVISLLVATPVVFYSARPFFANAWNNIRSRTLGMDVPVALAVGLAYMASVYATFARHGDVYFDSVTMFVFFLLLGRFVEMTTRHRTLERQQALTRLLPDEVLRERGGVAAPCSLGELQTGDLVRVTPGHIVPVDGVIAEGRGDLDESMLSGEARPVYHGPGERVMAGSMNLDGVLLIRADMVGENTVLAGIGKLLDAAVCDRPQLAQTADRIAGHFVAGVLLLATAVAIAWWFIDPDVAFVRVLSVLVVTCPCALSLATPAALAAATGRLAGSGLLVTSGRALENLAHVDQIVFDKTGTLTSGRPQLCGTRLLNPQSGLSLERCGRIAATLEQHSVHPFAAAFAAIAPCDAVTDLRVHAGHGVEGRINGRLYRCGRRRFAAPSHPDLDDNRESAHGDSLVYLGDGNGLIAEFRLRDEVRAEAASTIARLQGLGLSVAVASGDLRGSVERVAGKLGIADYHAELTPAGKLALISGLQDQGHFVAVVGDGLNDAPVLGRADVSIAMENATELAQSQADFIIPGHSLTSLAEGVLVARKTLKIIRQNIGWAISYNVLFVPMAAMGWLAPWMAAIGMSLSSMLVVLNALRLRRDSNADDDTHDTTRASRVDGALGATA